MTLKQLSLPLLKQLLDVSVDGIFAFDRDFRLIAWNRRMELSSGIAMASAIGQRSDELFPDLKDSGELEIFRRVLNGERTTVRGTGLVRSPVDVP